MIAEGIHLEPMSSYSDIVTPDHKRSWSERNSPSEQFDCPVYKNTCTRMSVDQKLDLLIKTTQSNSATLDELTAKLSGIEGSVTVCQNDNDYLRNVILTLDGRLQKAESEIKRLSECSTDLTWRSMKHNMIAYFVDEPQNENYYKTARNFLLNSMKIPEDRLRSDIVIDLAHRMGAVNAAGPRPLIIRFTTHSGRRGAMSFCGNLKGTQMYVREQLPQETTNRSFAQIGEFKRLNAIEGNKASLVRDTLYLNKKEVDPKFASNEIIMDSRLDRGINHEDIYQSDATSVNSNKIQGYVYRATKFVQAKTVLTLVKSDVTQIKASHVTYAYRVDEGIVATGHFDDGEYGVSQKMLEMMEKENKFGIIIICKYDGKQKMKWKERNKHFMSLTETFIKERL